MKLFSAEVMHDARQDAVHMQVGDTAAALEGGGSEVIRFEVSPPTCVRR